MRIESWENVNRVFSFLYIPTAIISSVEHHVSNFDGRTAVSKKSRKEQIQKNDDTALARNSICGERIG